MTVSHLESIVSVGLNTRTSDRQVGVGALGLATCKKALAGGPAHEERLGGRLHLGHEYGRGQTSCPERKLKSVWLVSLASVQPPAAVSDTRRRP